MENQIVAQAENQKATWQQPVVELISISKETENLPGMSNDGGTGNNSGTLAS
jgi:hypothetical protein